MASLLPHHLNFKRAKDCGFRVSAPLNSSQLLGCLESIGTIETIFLSAVTGFLLVVVKGSLLVLLVHLLGEEAKINAIRCLQL